MKKHPILCIILFLLFIFSIYSFFVIREVFHLKNYIESSSKTKSYRIKTIGLEKLCDRKNIIYDEDKKNIEKSLNYLISVRPNYVNYYKEIRGYSNFKFVFANDPQRGQPSEENINDLKNNIKIFNESFKIDSIKDFDWNVFDPTDNDSNNPIKRTFIFKSDDLNNISILISIVDSYINKNDSNESSNFLNSLLKIHLFNLYVNKGEFINHACDGLEGLYIFYDNLINNYYSEQEMKSMLVIVKKIIDLSPDIKEYFKIHYDDSKKLYDFAFKEFPIISNSISLISGDPYKELNKIYDKIKEGKYKEVTDLFSSNPTLSSIFISPAFQFFYNHYNKYIDTISRLALFQAVLEDKLKMQITAVDPFDKSPIRFTVDKEGKKHFYCLGHEGKDLKGNGNNITNCDTELKNLLSSLEKE